MEGVNTAANAKLLLKYLAQIGGMRLSSIARRVARDGPRATRRRSGRKWLHECGDRQRERMLRHLEAGWHMGGHGDRRWPEGDLRWTYEARRG